MRLMPASLRLRLAGALLALLCLGALAAAGLSRLQARSTDELLEETSLAAQAQDLLRTARLDPRGTPKDFAPDLGWSEAYRRPGAAFYTLFAPSGSVVARSANLRVPLPPLSLPPGAVQGPLALVGPDQLLAQAFAVSGGGRLVVARANLDVHGASDDDGLDLWAPVLGAVGLLLCAVAVAAAVAHWSLQPLRRAAEQAAAIGPARPHVRLELSGMPAEVRSFGEAVNRALDRVAAAYEAEKRFTADAAHALRTPLTVLDLRLQQAEAGASLDIPRLRRDVDRVIVLATGLLRLARSDAAADALIMPANLARVVREAAVDLAPLFEAARRRLQLDLPEAALVGGPAEPWREAVTALLENALIHGAGSVVVRLRPAASQFELEVSDEGAGVPAEMRSLLFDRFRKVDTTSPGAGLGLSVVAALARRHGGSASFSGPSTIRVEVPAAAPAAYTGS